ncbi:hypothetical protein CYMTET_42115, partial [Cymbomonas tetramitiformis]
MPGGVIFGCNNATEGECFELGLFGMSGGRSRLVKAIRPGTPVFLFNFQTKYLHGVFITTTRGRWQFEPNAFGGRFPSQVRVRRQYVVPPMHESRMPSSLYEGSNRFKLELSSQEVDELKRLLGVNETTPCLLPAACHTETSSSLSSAQEAPGPPFPLLPPAPSSDLRTLENIPGTAPPPNLAPPGTDPPPILALPGTAPSPNLAPPGTAPPPNSAPPGTDPPPNSAPPSTDQLVSSEPTRVLPAVPLTLSNAKAEATKPPEYIDLTEEAAPGSAPVEAKLSISTRIANRWRARLQERQGQQDSPAAPAAPTTAHSKPPPVGPGDMAAAGAASLAARALSLAQRLVRKPPAIAQRSLQAVEADLQPLSPGTQQPIEESGTEVDMDMLSPSRSLECSARAHDEAASTMLLSRDAAMQPRPALVVEDGEMQSEEDDEPPPPGVSSGKNVSRAKRKREPPIPSEVSADTRILSAAGDGPQVRLPWVHGDVESRPESLDAEMTMAPPMLPQADCTVCSTALAHALQGGLLPTSSKPSFKKGSEFETKEWLGDSVLGSKVKQTIHESYSQVMSMQAMRAVSQLSVRNDVLSMMYEQIGVCGVLGLEDAFTGKKRADIMEAVCADLSLNRGMQPELADHALASIANAAIVLGYPMWQASQQADARSSQRAAPACLQEQVTFLKQFEFMGQGRHYTHSSLRGGRDYSTRSGKLLVPDDEESQRNLAKAIAACYRMHRPLTFVELSTVNHPYVEDIDIDAVGLPPHATPPDSLIHHQAFWEFRAYLLMKLFPEETSLELLLFTASGFNYEKGCPKTSFHCVWPSLIIDRERAHAVRLASVDGFNSGARMFSWLGDLQRNLDHLTTRQVAPNPNPGFTNDLVKHGKHSEEPPAKPNQAAAVAGESDETAFDTLIDITGVRAGSLRMVFNDKVIKPSQAYAKRPLKPVGVIRFEKKASAQFGVRMQWVHKGSHSLPDEDWVLRASVRRPDSTPLSPWRCPLPKKSWKKKKSKPGGSEREFVRPNSAAGRAQLRAALLEEARRGRRRYTGDVADLKRELDKRLGDDEDTGGSLQLVPSKGERVGNRRYLYRNPKVKGCLHLQLPSGELRIQGNEEQQAFLHFLVKDFTTEWDGDVAISMANLKLLGGNKGKAKMKKGKGKGKHFPSLKFPGHHASYASQGSAHYYGANYAAYQQYGAYYAYDAAAQQYGYYAQGIQPISLPRMSGLCVFNRVTRRVPVASILAAVLVTTLIDVTVPIAPFVALPVAPPVAPPVKAATDIPPASIHAARGILTITITADVDAKDQSPRTGNTTEYPALHPDHRCKHKLLVQSVKDHINSE